MRKLAVLCLFCFLCFSRPTLAVNRYYLKANIGKQKKAKPLLKSFYSCNRKRKNKKTRTYEQLLREESKFFFDHLDRIIATENMGYRFIYFKGFLLYFKNLVEKHWKLKNPHKAYNFSADYMQLFTVKLFVREKRKYKIQKARDFFEWTEDIKIYHHLQDIDQYLYTMIYSSFIQLDIEEKIKKTSPKKSLTKSQELSTFHAEY